MTVQELIEALLLVEDKTMKVKKLVVTEYNDYYNIYYVSVGVDTDGINIVILD